jgi:type I restriction enzyme S subunit
VKRSMVSLGTVALIDRTTVAPGAMRAGYVGLEHIDPSGDIYTGHAINISALASSKFKFSARHVLFGKLRPYLRKVARPDFDGVCSTDILPLLPKKRLDRDYLYHYLRSPKVIDLATARSSGANLPRISPNLLAEFMIPLPPLNEQKRIAAILDAADSICRKREQALQIGNTFVRSLFLEMFGDPITNPRGWKRVSLAEIIEFVGGSQPPKETFSMEDGPDKIRLVQIRDFKTDRFKTFIPKSLAKRSFVEDDVMIGRYGPPVFQILRGLSGSYNVALMKAAPRSDLVTKDFIFHLLQVSRLHNFVVANSERTAGQTGVNLDLLERFIAYLPPRSEQDRFADRVALCTRLRQRATESAAESDRLCRALTQLGFQGDL